MSGELDLCDGPAPRSLAVAEARALALVDPERAPSGGAAVAATAFLVALVLGCASLGRFFDSFAGVRLEPGSLVRTKLRYFDGHRDEFDVVFAGSSRVYRQLGPPGFDATLRRGGIDVRSFNMGAAGSDFYETYRTVNWILERRPANLEWILVELQDPFQPPDERNDYSLRAIQWHDRATTAIALRVVLASDRGLAEKLAEARSHVHQFLFRFANVSMAWALLRDVLGRADEVSLAEYEGHGAFPLEEEARRDSEIIQRNQDFVAEADLLPGKVRRRAQAGPGRVPPPFLLAFLSDWVADIRAAGVEPVFVVCPPLWERELSYEAAQASGVLPALLAYDDPLAYPEFYRGSLLYDFGHLNTRGSTQLTKRLAQDFLALLEARDATAGRR